MTKPVRERSHTGFFSYVEAHGKHPIKDDLYY